MSALRRHSPRRSCLAVPGSSQKMIDKAKNLAADQVFLDLEDAVAPTAKTEARVRIAEALNGPGWGDQLRSVRVNDWTTEWTYGDVIEVVSAAGATVDSIVLPKVTDASHVRALDLLLTQIERVHGLPVGAIGIEPQIEDAVGLTNIHAIAAASERVQALVFGPGDFMASIGMRTLTVGAQPPGYDADAYHHILMTILLAARAHGIAALDGPFVAVHDVAGFRTAAARTAALGYDGKWVLHPGQIDAANELFGPSQADVDRAVAMVSAYAEATSAGVGARGAIMVGDEMVDEAGAKMAAVVVEQGRRLGMAATNSK